MRNSLRQTGTVFVEIWSFLTYGGSDVGYITVYVPPILMSILFYLHL